MVSMVDDGTNSVGQSLHMSPEEIRKMKPDRSSEEITKSLQNAATTADELLNRCNHAYEICLQDYHLCHKCDVIKAWP
jgi:hypothetical protein